MVNFLKAAFNIVALFCISFPSYAHFGSKGPFGGSVSTAITQGNTVYIGTSFGGVYESTDSTLSAWRARPVGLKSGKITALAHTGSYLFAATADSGIYMLGGHVGNDRYWIKKNKGLGTLEVNCLLAIDSITLLAGTNGADGLYLSRDKGDTWAKADGPSMHHYQVTSLVKIGDRVIQGALDGGAWTSTDLGHTWQDYNDENTLHVEGAVTLSYNASTSELMLSNGGGLYMTKVGAAVAPVYSAVKNGLPAGLEIRAITNNGSHWYLATQKGIFVSSSSTLAWQALNVGLPTLNTYTVIPFKDHLLAGTKQYGVFTTSISGGSWSSANTGLNNLSTYASVTTGSDVAVVATESGVFVSKNITASPAIYTALNKGLTDSLHVNSLLFVGENLWAATRNSGVFISRDTGLTWMNYGTEALSFTKLTLQQGRIYAITEAGALFSSAVDIADWRAEQDDLPIGSLVTAVGSYSDKIMVGTATHG
ncbi:MAG TPA: hypothetical protein VL947_03470, partial [Cytophagales bacterium]|nr:hypothetical protein [Cytophagales bacterium]